MLIDLVKLICSFEVDSEPKIWNKKLSDWLYKHKEDKTIISVDSWGVVMVECSTARRYIVSARSVKNKEKLIIEVDRLESDFYKNKIDGLEVKNSKYDNEFHTIFNFQSWDKTYVNIVDDFIECDSVDSVMNMIFKWTYGIVYYGKYTSIRSKLTTVRKVINESEIRVEFKELILKHLKLPKFINDSLQSRVEKEVILRAKDKNIEKIKVQDVKNAIGSVEKEVEKYLNRGANFKLGRKSRKFINDDEIGLKEGVTNLMIYLTLSTGRRPIELLKMSSFSKKSDNLVIVKDLAKKRDKDSELVMPILFSNSDLVLRAIEFLRNSFDVSTLRSRESNITRKLYAYIEDDWNNVAPDFLHTSNDKFKKCRAVYILSLETLINQSIEDIKMSQGGFMSKFLGHDEEDISTQSSYYKASILVGNFNKKRYLESINDVIDYLRSDNKK